MSHDLTKLKRPYYLNDCDCRRVGYCVVCRSKWGLKLRNKYTRKDRDEFNSIARIKYATMTEEESIAHKLKKHNEYKRISPEKKAEKNTRKREQYRIMKNKEVEQ